MFEWGLNMNDLICNRVWIILFTHFVQTGFEYEQHGT